jgi:protein SCO1
MSETVSEPQKNVVLVRSQSAMAHRMFVAAAALGLALLVSFLFSRYFAYRTVQANFYGQALVPGKQAFDFHLIDQNGKAFQLTQMKGKAVLFSFGFTHCPNVCPTTLSDLAKIYKMLPPQDREKVRVLFISVDPQRDKPETMKNYVPYFDDSFIGLTGSDAAVAEAAKAYGAYYEIIRDSGANPDVYTVNHSALTYLINPEGKWKLLYNFDQLGDSKKMVQDIEQVLAGA